MSKSDIANRIRALDPRGDDEYIGRLCDEAADTIERLEREVSALRGQLASAMHNDPDGWLRLWGPRMQQGDASRHH